MKTNNLSFSFRRLWWVMRRDVCVNRKKYAWTFAIHFFIYFGLIWVTTLNPKNSFVPVLFIALYFLQSVFAASNFFAPWKEKGKAMVFLALPASNAEKFVYRVLFVIVFYMLALWLLMSSADVAQYLVRSQFFPDSYVSRPFLYEMLSVFKESSVPLLLLFFCQALVVLLHFCKMAWLRVIIAFAIFYYGADLLSWMDGVVMDKYFLGGNIVVACLVLLCWYCSYRLFCRSQIV